MLSSHITRRLAAGVAIRPASQAIARTAGARTFAHSARTHFIADLFKDRKTLQQRNEALAEKQREEAVHPETPEDTKVVFLTKENAPGFEPFSAEKDMPGFRVEQWKSKLVPAQELEATYSADAVRALIIQSYDAVSAATPLGAAAALESVPLADLALRFRLAKQVQADLGFDISDYVFSRAHTLGALADAVAALVSKRYTNERNPNAIVLRPEDFSAGNVYLNEELDKYQQDKYYQELLQKANESA